MTTFTVANLNDSGAGSLRDAIAQANGATGPDTINFAVGLEGHTITLTSGDLNLTSDITIDGDIVGDDDKADITISGGGNSRVFDVSASSTVNLQSLTLTGGSGTGGDDGFGGAILNAGSLTITDSTIQNSTAATVGGAIFSTGTLSVISSTINGNSSKIGGGIGLSGATATLINVTVTANSGSQTGAISVVGGTFNITNSTIVGNSAPLIGGLQADFDALVIVTNSIIAGNGGVDVFEGGGNSTVTATSSIFGSNVVDVIGGTNGNVEIVIALGLGQLLDNGGTVLTMSPLDGSILIGAGNAGVLPLDCFNIDNDNDTTEILPLDGRGGPRIIGGVLDVGAVEQTVNETIRGTAGANIIIGGLGIDSLSGLGGDDQITGDQTDSLLDGGDDVDTLFVAADFDDVSDGQIVNIENVVLTSSGILKLDNQTEALSITGFSGDDDITGGQGADTIKAGAGIDYITGAQNDVLIDGESNTDFLRVTSDFTSTGDAQIVNIESIVMTALGAQLLDLSTQTEGFNITTTGTANLITAGAGADHIFTTLQDTLIDGGGGIDILTAAGSFANTSDAQLANVEIIEVLTSINLNLQSEDLIIQAGGVAGVWIIAGNGDDVIGGTANGDVFDGGLGIDKVRYRASATGVSVDLGSGIGLSGDAAGDTFVNIENITGSTQSDALFGDDGANALRGRESGDILVGRTGNDVVQGGDGDDVLNGNRDHDVLSGGLGADSFLLQSSGLDRDRITDFESGIDTLTIRAVRFGAGLAAGNLSADSFVANTSGDAEGLEDRFIYNTLDGTLTFDSNGSLGGGREVIARFTGKLPVLHASDFEII